VKWVAPEYIVDGRRRRHIISDRCSIERDDETFLDVAGAIEQFGFGELAQQVRPFMTELIVRL
jgi:hypothetical protein